MLEKMLENPSDSKEIKPVNPERNQPCIFFGRIAKAEAPIPWPPMQGADSLQKHPNTGKE